jgi:hypothetical protein
MTLNKHVDETNAMESCCWRKIKQMQWKVVVRRNKTNAMESCSKKIKQMQWKVVRRK